MTVLNDADAAGVAEMTFGAGTGVQRHGADADVRHRDRQRAVHPGDRWCPTPSSATWRSDGKDAEKRASERAKVLHDLSWSKWAGRVDEYMQHVEALLSPGLIIVGGGISKESHKWVPLLTGVRAKIVPAALLNDAGIVGAAMSAAGIGIG